jgi:hypothetical protein
MAKTRREIALAAAAVSSRNARRRRFQRALQEMRDQDLVVHVREEIEGEFRDVPEYTPEATFRAVYR